MLSPEERNALTELRNHPDIVTLKKDKGNVTVVMNRNDYDNQIFKMLHDQSTYQPFKCDPTRATEKTVNTFVSGLKQNKKISTRDEFAVKSSDGRAPRLYGLPKIHKQGIPLRPIISFVESPTYNLSKEIARNLSHLVGRSERHVKNSYDFVEFLNTIEVGDNESMVSFDVVPLFTKIPVDLAMEIAKKRLESYTTEDLREITNWSVEEIHLQATYLKFRNKFFRQIYGTAMGSPVSVVVANLIMEDIEERAIDNFGQPPRGWKRFVDDTFVIFDKVAVDKCFTHLNQMQTSIKFTMEGEMDNCISFLDISITRDHTGTLDTNIYRKPTLSERYLNFKSEHPLEHKFAVVNALTHRATSLIRDENKKRMELKHTQNVLTLNGYPNWLLNRK